MRFGIIGGTGFYEVGVGVETRKVDTDYGAAVVGVAPLGGQEVAFIARHGRDHSIPPHRVNYRANIAALKSLGVTRILASAAVGSLNQLIQPGEYALPSQFVDFTHGRASTFYDGPSDGARDVAAPDRCPPLSSTTVRHIDMTVPYCPTLREELERAARFLGGGLHPSAVYVCTQGPRFETPAEIEMFQRLGGDIVGMTGVPEAPLAREAGLCYAALAVVTNWAAGLSQEPLAHEEISARMAAQMERVKQVFASVIEGWQERRCDVCAPAADSSHDNGRADPGSALA